MAILVEAKAMANRDATATATAAAKDSSGKNATPANHGDCHPAIADIDDEDDELFELDIARLDGGLSDDGHHSRSTAVVAAAADDAGGHALLANCLLPVRSVSKAVPVDASSALSPSSYYPYYSGYCSSRRLIFTGGGVGRRFLFGRSAAGNSSRLFSFSSRGFETYFQRY